MKSVAHILEAKADHRVYSIAPTACVLDAVKLMAERNIGALVVMEGEKIVGIITERDYARKIVLMTDLPADWLDGTIERPHTLKIAVWAEMDRLDD